MRRHIKFMNTYYEITISGPVGKRSFQVNGAGPETACLTETTDTKKIIHMGNESTRIQMASKGDTTFIRAWGRTFTLDIIDSVERASGAASARGCLARAPMPGVVVDITVAPGDLVAKGHPLVTIESMKILMVIKASCNGKISEIHVKPEQSFEKNALLVTLEEEEN